MFFARRVTSGPCLPPVLFRIEMSTRRLLVRPFYFGVNFCLYIFSSLSFFLASLFFISPNRFCTCIFFFLYLRILHGCRTTVAPVSYFYFFVLFWCLVLLRHSSVVSSPPRCLGTSANLIDEWMW